MNRNIKELLEQYEDAFTLDGDLKPQPGVTEAKVQEAQRLWEAAYKSRVAEAQFEELFKSTDLSFSIGQLINIQTIPQLPEELKSIDGLASSRTVRDFNPVVLRSLLGSSGITGAGVDSRGAAVVVPEGTPYPIVTVSSDEESFYSKLAKRGFRFDFTFESIINDLLGELERLPQEMLDVTVNTVYAELFDALDAATQDLESVTLPDGTATDPNMPVSADAIIAASVALENRTINGNKIGRVPRVNVIVPTGQQRFLEYSLAQYGRVIEVQDGALTLGPDSEMQALMPALNIIESDRVTGTNWILMPPPGGGKGRPILERLTLRGYENPEIRVRNDQGYTVGGGQVGIWNGGFDADTASYRYRHITGAVLWDDTFVVKSDGTGA